MPNEQVEIRDLQEGNYVLVEGEACQIQNMSTSKPGKHGSAKARIEADEIFNDGKHIITQPVDAKVRQPLVERKQGQVVSVDDDEAQIMDLESFKTFTFIVPEDVEMSPDDEIEYLEYESNRKLVSDD